jgi:hypothetical protein
MRLPDAAPSPSQAELGAFYPLLLLRPLEGGQMAAGDLPAAAAALPCLAGIASEPQVRQ